MWKAWGVCCLTVLLLSASSPASRVAASDLEVDETATVSDVIDGDTFDADPVGRVRLADIDAPEYYESGYKEARDFLVSLVYNREVYLDVDDVYVTDPYDRLVCVVYVQYDATHLLNVNKALLDEGVAWISDYPNEFSPAEWTLYVDYPGASPSPPPEDSPSPAPGDSPPPAQNEDGQLLWLGALAAAALSGFGLLYGVQRRRERR